MRFAGYAAIFNQVDRGGDIIRPGAFGDLEPGREMPLLWQHDPLRPIGMVGHAREDDRGLQVIATVRETTRTGRLALKMLRSGAVTGLSFGYRVREARGHIPRELLDLDVAEFSLVTHPMQSRAQIIALADADN
ncbi:prohead peptidase. Unknown type peptidase. MEROPS family U35 [Parasphingorhabdus marina DSM 22363]|uniref:Prohead serine protease domain-containing protein n=1 Tax=Parasphingorhabdus marina DSM 22363 TaxID=1123272 RepID=A0A1N6CMB5_9SPHN|nr:HK97 family phage prohead protease [Parasphingorhabdus marina]SIN59632.1 prohead peptidase. Unknown type peptidase. MEROPS family U35 [Parasphingorhabdus marina DSM 22363]